MLMVGRLEESPIEKKEKELQACAISVQESITVAYSFMGKMEMMTAECDSLFRWGLHVVDDMVCYFDALKKYRKMIEEAVFEIDISKVSYVEIKNEKNELLSKGVKITEEPDLFFFRDTLLKFKSTQFSYFTVLDCSRSLHTILSSFHEYMSQICEVLRCYDDIFSDLHEYLDALVETMINTVHRYIELINDCIEIVNKIPYEVDGENCIGPVKKIVYKSDEDD